MKTHNYLRYLLMFGALGGYSEASANESTDPTSLTLRPAEGTIERSRGLKAWKRIYAVASHHRCVNCHTGEQHLPMWSGPTFGKTQPHGMNIHAGASRIGAETLLCSTCHMTSAEPNSIPHAPPHAGLPWRLAPVEFTWFGLSSNALCQQLRDPERNGGRTGAALVEHILHDADTHAFITWAFAPGGGREPPPGTMQDHLDDMVLWTAASMPCPSDPT